MSRVAAEAGPDPRHVKRATLTWTGEGSVFRGSAAGGPEVVVDGDGEAGPSPMDTLLLAFAGCMAADVQMILEKGRVPLTSLRFEAVGVRAPEPPRRFQGVELVVRAEGLGAGGRPKLERALELSRETYCSVLHTLRADLDLRIRIEQD